MAKDLFVSALLDVYGSFLNEKQRMIAECYYYDDLSLGEIAENEGMSRQGARDYITRARSRLYELEEKSGYCKKFLRLKELAQSAENGDDTVNGEIYDIIKSL